MATYQNEAVTVADELNAVLEKFKAVLCEIKDEVERRWKIISEKCNDLHIPNERLDYSDLVDDCLQYVNAAKERMRNIMKNVEREEIKVLLLGRVGVGKSTVINAMLGCNFFIASFGSATSCFVMIKMSRQWQINFRNEKQLFNSCSALKERVDELSNFSKSNCLKSDEFLEVLWDCRISGMALGRNVELIDAPGIGGKSDVTEMVEKQSVKSNIFVIIVTNVLGEEEKKFIRFQAEHSTRPDMFILVNKCDCADSDDEQRTLQNREQIRNECIKILMEDGGLSRSEAAQRIFFISGQEMLRARLGKRNANGFTNFQRKRISDFERFEESLSAYVIEAKENQIKTAYGELNAMKNDVQQKIKIFFQEFNKIKSRLKPKYCDNVIKMINEKVLQIEADIVREIRCIRSDIVDRPIILNSEPDRNNSNDVTAQEFAETALKELDRMISVVFFGIEPN